MKMKILITGIGITGKSTLRRTLKRKFPWVIDIDGDYQKMPEVFNDNQSYIIEDVHALTDEACLPLDNYNLIIYLLPDLFTHVLFWMRRVWRWFQVGEGSWDKKTQSRKGSGKKYDYRNIPLFLGLMISDLLNRGKWIEGDTRVLSLFKDRVIVAKSSLSEGKIKFSFTHKF